MCEINVLTAEEMDATAFMPAIQHSVPTEVMPKFKSAKQTLFPR